ncbi:MAG: bifunctional UDP-sugar hydrolase/5'-nucleotidase [Bacteroidales bacterium]
MKGRRLLRNIGLILIFVSVVSCTGKKSGTISIIATTDIHGVILPYDYVEGRELKGSLAGVSTYINELRKEGKEYILLDNGDNIQGQPAVYYYNFIDTASQHIMSQAFNYLKYDAGTVGNHDIETGHSVYDRLAKEYNFPLLAANAIRTSDGKPYFKPYTIIKKGGLKIAVFGLVTPYIPNWLPPQLYSGMEFRDMVQTAKDWMPEIIAQKPDLVIGLFHSGWDKEWLENKETRVKDENGSVAVAYEVPGFDIILNGHDHSLVNDKIVNSAGDTVLILDGGSRSEFMMRADVNLSGKGKNCKVSSRGTLVRLADVKGDPDFISAFSNQDKTIRGYVDKVIGKSSATISSRDSYFGPSAFTGLIHSLQKEISGADISFAAPLSFDVSIPEGPITVGDMFKLYRFENMLYTIKLSGEEIKKYLEYSYGLWFRTMKSQNDNMMLFRSGKDGALLLTGGKARFENPSYNFDSASGIEYIVDLSKNEGERITITKGPGGNPFDLAKIYTVAVNSYRGSGGGGHLTRGVGLNSEEIARRLVISTDKDLRYYIIKYIEKNPDLTPIVDMNWSVIPRNWVEKASVRDRSLLFSK